MIEGTTATGFNFRIEDEALNNFELLEFMADIEEKPQLMPKVVRMLLGEEQKNALYDHVRTERGTVPADKISAELSEILATKEVKN